MIDKRFTINLEKNAKYNNISMLIIYQKRLTNEKERHFERHQKVTFREIFFYILLKLIKRTRFVEKKTN